MNNPILNKPARLGQFIKAQGEVLNRNTIIHMFYGSRAAFQQSAVIAQQRKIPDVSYYQGVIDWDKMRTMTDAVIIRAGQGLWGTDSQWLRNWSEAGKRGMLRGCYWFYDDRESPGAQAQKLVNLIKDDRPEMEVVIDWETFYGGAFGGLGQVVAMMQEVERLAPWLKIKNDPYESRVAMYTGYYWFTGNSNPLTNAAHYNYLKTRPLWEAWYTSNAALVKIPAPWTNLLFWQFGTPAVGLDYGVKTAEIDMNFVNLTQAEFDLRYGMTTNPPPPEETGMFYGRNKTTLTNIRSGAGANYADIGDLLLNDEIEADRKQNVSGVDWWHITRITRGGALVSLPGIDCWCWGTNIEEHAAPPPAVQSIFITHDFSDTLTLNGVTYSATYTVPNVEYKPKP